MPTNAAAIPRLSLLDRQQCEIIHHASLGILRRTGVRVHHEGAWALLRRNDANFSDGNLVRFLAAARQRRSPYSSRWASPSKTWPPRTTSGARRKQRARGRGWRSAEGITGACE